MKELETIYVALEDLRRLNDSGINVLALIPDRDSLLAGEGECWRILDINQPNGEWLEISCAATPVVAIEEARIKIEEAPKR